MTVAQINSLRSMDRLELERVARKWGIVYKGKRLTSDALRIKLIDRVVEDELRDKADLGRAT